MNLIIKNPSQIVTCSGFEGKAGKAMSDLGVLTGKSLAITDGLISHIDDFEEISKVLDVDLYEIIDATGKALLPGFVDSHTHFVFGGYREEEFSWRLSGQSYMEIMEKGGGILSSVRSTEGASFDELYDIASKRLDSMLRFGVTTVEGKSGYGLSTDTELKQLKVMAKLQETHPIAIATTFLGAHAIPKEYKQNPDVFVDIIIDEMLPLVAKDGLAEFCDVFCEKNVFTVEQSRRILNRAKELGMKVKLHADEIHPLNGAGLAAELGAVSADHLLVASDEGLLAMRDAGVVATLLPGTAFSLKEHYARARYMVDQGLKVAIATDLNPGSCFTNSIPLIIALSTLYMGLTTEETITALTINGAAAIDRADTVGSIDIGKQGDVILLDYPSYKFLPYHVGVNIVSRVIKKGNIIV